MAATRKNLVSLHGNRVGLTEHGDLQVDGKLVPAMNDAGVMLQPNAAPTAKTTTATLTAAELLSKFLTGQHTAGATQTYTLPTGALLEAAIQALPELKKVFRSGMAFEWELINISAAALDTITMAAAATGHTIVGAALVPSNHVTTGGLNGTSTSKWRTRRTASETFVTYRAG